MGKREILIVHGIDVIVICNFLFLFIFREYLPVMMDCYLMVRMYLCIMYYSVFAHDITII